MKPTLGNRTCRLRAVMLTLLSLALGCSLHAASAQTTWNGNADATWSNVSNWTTGLPGTTTAVIFGTPIPGTGSDITLATGSVANSLSIQDSYTFSGGSLTLANGAIQVAAGKTFTVNTALIGTGSFTLTGGTGSEGIFAGGMNQTGDTLDLNVNSGTWTHVTGTSRIADDVTVTGSGTVLNLDSGLFQVRDDFIVTAGAVLNLNGTGVLSFSTATLSADAIMYMRNGAVVNLGANNAVVAADFDRLYLAQDAGGDTVVLNMNAFNLSTNRLILGERASNQNGVINGTGTLTVIGGDYDLYEGTIHANLASTGSLAFEKFGPGTVTLKGDNSGLASTGASVLNEGTLVLDYTANNATKLRAASTLNLRTGTLKIVGNESAATTQEVASLSLASGGLSVIDMNSGTGQTATLKLNAIVRTNSQGTLRLNLNDAGAAVTTTTANNATHGLVGASAFATVKDSTGTWFATVDGSSNIVAMASTAKNDVATWASGDHVTDSGAGYTGTVTNATLNSLRFDAAGGSAVNLQAGGSLSIASGGVLVTDQVTGGAPGIFGGTLSSGSGELIVTHDSAMSFEISSQIAGTQAVTKTGEGTLILSGNNTYTGQT
ncbi:MAG: autotransporter-associated beta strand repeat-containing protein, partial [Patescibacteria group bacterium]|nr:autotransporter-associated beta strand repeat-containing protein [Patescibacteria group bacterium]